MHKIAFEDKLINSPAYCNMRIKSYSGIFIFSNLLMPTEIPNYLPTNISVSNFWNFFSIHKRLNVKESQKYLLAFHDTSYVRTKFRWDKNNLTTENVRQ